MKYANALKIEDFDLDNDLVWDITRFNRTEAAISFFDTTRQLLPVYSGSTRKLYTEYKIALTQQDPNRLVTLPNFERFDSMYHFISEECIRPTPLFIFPSALEGTDKFYIGGRTKSGRVQTAPVTQGFGKLIFGRLDNQMMIPVIRNKNLRTLPSENHPMLMIDFLDVGNLPFLSDFTKLDICRGVRQQIWNALKNPNVFK